MAFGGSGLIRGVAFGWSGLLRGVAFGGSGLIRGILLYEVENGFSDIFVHYIKGYFVSKYLYFKI